MLLYMFCVVIMIVGGRFIGAASLVPVEMIVDKDDIKQGRIDEIETVTTKGKGSH